MLIVNIGELSRSDADGPLGQAHSPTCVRASVRAYDLGHAGRTQKEKSEKKAKFTTTTTHTYLRKLRSRSRCGFGARVPFVSRAGYSVVL